MEFIIIDDSEFDLFTQKQLLLKSGLANSVTTFNDPQNAIAHLRKLTGEIAETVILLDLQMPGLNGFEFTFEYGHLIKAVRDRIRLLMISSTVDESDFEQAEANPHILHLLSKPLEISTLRRILAG